MDHSPLGAHTSTAGGLPCAVVEGHAIGANAIQLFTSNQKRWKGKPIDDKTAQLWRAERCNRQIDHIMSHDSYLINLGSPSEEGLGKSRIAFAEEIARCQILDIDYLNFHPGSALNESEEQCLDTIIQSLLLCEPLVQKGKTKLLLETTAGQGSNVGYCFEHLGYIIEKVHRKIPIGVCVDTCHIFAAGYDIRTAEGWQRTLQIFEREIGLKYLCAFHLNDSVKALGSKVDRHACLGEGMIGWDCFKFIMTEPRFSALPKYLETPGRAAIWGAEIEELRKFEAASDI